jgi:hypothetical protein
VEAEAHLLAWLAGLASYIASALCSEQTKSVRQTAQLAQPQPNGIAWKYKKSVLLCCLYGGGGGSLSTLARILYKSFLAGLDLDLDPSTTKYTKKQFQFFTKFVFTIKI